LHEEDTHESTLKKSLDGGCMKTLTGSPPSIAIFHSIKDNLFTHWVNPSQKLNLA
jgi:hypothetical protein